jgi:putative transposase
VPVPVKFKAPFSPGNSYHLVFRSVDGIRLFEEQDDYALFLRQYAHYLQPFLDTLAYNLLANHSHFIVQVKERKPLIQQLMTIPNKFKTCAMNRVICDNSNDHLVDQMVERQVNSFMSSYVLTKNKSLDRKGGMFQSPFRRSFITNDAHLNQAIIYVHANAEKHGIVKDFKQYQHSSYNEILWENSTYVCAEKVLQFFGGRNRFIDLHKTQIDHFYKNNWPKISLESRDAVIN